MAKLNEGRLIVLIFSLAVIPLYFIAFFSLMNINWQPLGPYMVLFQIFINPITFILCWELFMLLFGTRIATSYEKMKKIISPISIRYNLYYGLTAIVFILAILFPFITPLVNVLVLGSLAWRMFTWRIDWEKTEKTPWWVVILILIVMALPAVCSIFFYVNYMPQALHLWNEIYVTYFIYPLRLVARALATAVTFGSLVFMFMYGTSEYELVLTKEGARPRAITYVRILQFGLFVFFIMLIVLGEVLGVINQYLFKGIQYFTIALNVLIILGNLRKSREISGVNKSIVSYILIIAFFTFNAIGADAWESVILVISSLLYIITFAVSFMTSKD